jgi:hypothetical protein
MGLARFMRRVAPCEEKWVAESEWDSLCFELRGSFVFPLRGSSHDESGSSSQNLAGSLPAYALFPAHAKGVTPEKCRSLAKAFYPVPQLANSTLPISTSAHQHISTSSPCFSFGKAFALSPLQ